jgi:hypothetical protein
MRKLCDNGECLRSELQEALKVAERTYAALERNQGALIEALRAKGLPDSWLNIEIAKAAKIRAALYQRENS